MLQNGYLGWVVDYILEATPYAMLALIDTCDVLNEEEEKENEAWLRDIDSLKEIPPSEVIPQDLK